MNKLSGVIITFNEEKNIERCILSIIDIVDEIVVVDSFSNDKTENICEKYKTVFIKNKFAGHIEQKNFAISQAKNDYVLSLDADEALSETLRNEIFELKNNFNFDGYYFPRLTNYCGKWIKHSGWYPDLKLRLWNRTKGKWGGSNPHDKVIMNSQTKTLKLKGDILHYSFYTIEEHINQINKFSTIKAQVMFDKNKRTNILEILANPFFKFIKSYIFKLGILDGFYGLVICLNSANSNFLKLIKLYQKNKNKKNY